MTAPLSALTDPIMPPSLGGEMHLSEKLCDKETDGCIVLRDVFTWPVFTRLRTSERIKDMDLDNEAEG